MNKLAVSGLALAGIVVLAPLAFAQDAVTGGVPQADADAACAAIVDSGPGAPADVAAFRAAYNTVDNTDDGPAGANLSAEQERVIYLQELHVDYMGPDADPTRTFACEGPVAVFPTDPTPTPTPTTTAAPEPTTTVPVPTTAPSTTTAPLSSTTTPPSPVVLPTPDGPFGQIGGTPPVGGVDTGGGPA